jgi:hypothetical protein
MILILIMIFPARSVSSQDHEQDHDQEQEWGNNYFFGTAIAWAATHFHSPSRSTQVSVNRYALVKVFPALVLPVSFASPVTTATLSPNIRTCMSLETAEL